MAEEGEEIDYNADDVDYDGGVFYNGIYFSPEDLAKHKGGGSKNSRRRQIEHQIDINLSLLGINEKVNEIVPRFGISHTNVASSIEVQTKVVPERRSPLVSVYLVETTKPQISIDWLDLTHDKIKLKVEPT